MNPLSLTLFVFLVPSVAFADCKVEEPPFQELEKVIHHIASSVPKKLPHWPATPGEIRKAKCYRRAPLSDVEIFRSLESLKKENPARVTRAVFGISLENESEALAALLESLLRAPTGQPQKTFTNHCHDAICASKEIFGSEVGPRLLYMLARHGFNGSQYASKNADAWSPAELDSVLIGLEDWPEELRFIGGKNHRFARYPRGFVVDKGARVPKTKGRQIDADSDINVFDDWMKKPLENRRSILVHELGHIASDHGNLDETPEWRGLSGWRKVSETKWVAERPKALISEYGGQDPGEDFAESVLAYRYVPGKLKDASPEKYAYLRDKVFSGIEFTSEESCGQLNRLMRPASSGDGTDTSAPKSASSGR